MIMDDETILTDILSRRDDKDDAHQTVECEYIDFGENCNYSETHSSLTLLHLNIRSLAAKLDRLKVLLAELDNIKAAPDIILLCETWIDNQNCDLYKLQGYLVCEKHRDCSRGGGVCIFVK